MSETNSFRIIQGDLDQLLGAARLALSPERRASMYPVFQMVVEMMDSLDALDLKLEMESALVGGAVPGL